MEVDDDESVPTFPHTRDPTAAPVETPLDVDMVGDTSSDTGDEKSSSSASSTSSDSSDDEEPMPPVQNRPASHEKVPDVDKHPAPPLPKLDFTQMQSGATHRKALVKRKPRVPADDQHQPSTEHHPPRRPSWAWSEDAHIIDAADAAYAQNCARPFQPVLSDDEEGSAGEQSGALEDSEDEGQKTDTEDSGGYDSSWSNGAREESRLRAKNHSEFTTQEEDDEEDLMEFEEEAAAEDRKSHRRKGKVASEDDDDDGGMQSERQRKSKPKTRAKAKAKAATQPKRSRKGKEKQTIPASRDDEDGDDDDAIQDGEDAGDEGESAGPHKSGPIPQAAQDALLKAYQQLEEVVKRTALEIKKPEQLLWKLIGSDPKQVRATSGWNMYQMWLAAPDGGNQKYPPNGK